MKLFIRSRKRFGRFAGLVLMGLFLSGCGGGTPPTSTPTPAARTPVARPSAAATSAPSSEATPSEPSAMDRYLEQRKNNNQPKVRTDPLR